MFQSDTVALLVAVWSIQAATVCTLWRCMGGSVDRWARREGVDNIGRTWRAMLTAMFKVAWRKWRWRRRGRWR